MGTSRVHKSDEPEFRVRGAGQRPPESALCGSQRLNRRKPGAWCNRAFLCVALAARPFKCVVPTRRRSYSNVQFGHGMTLADESYAQTVATDNALWRRLDGENSVSSIRGIWLGSNPKRAVMRLVGLAKNMAAAAKLPDPLSRRGFFRYDVRYQRAVGMERLMVEHRRRP